MKTIRLTIIKPGWFSKEEVTMLRECKTGYPYLRDYKAMKAALSAGFVQCKMEEEGGQNG